MSARVPATILPCLINSSITGGLRIATSNVSPALILRSSSAFTSNRNETLCPLVRSNWVMSSRTAARAPLPLRTLSSAAWRGWSRCAPHEQSGERQGCPTARIVASLALWPSFGPPQCHDGAQVQAAPSASSHVPVAASCGAGSAADQRSGTAFSMSTPASRRGTAAAAARRRRPRAPARPTAPRPRR